MPKHLMSSSAITRQTSPWCGRIGQQLKEAGILPWLDVEQLPPGRPWQPLLEQQIKNIRSAAVCFGAAGISLWQQQEMYGFLNAFVKRGAPVIPLLLPDAPSAPDLPVFLGEMTWVDFRAQDSEPLKRLIWGITGKAAGFLKAVRSAIRVAAGFCTLSEALRLPESMR